ncbi:Uncharacterised protein [Actinobaculum suis]|uniref:Uncharacterized protein n=1 Tax=Actinobaculum suis TaxID=1657 RepID=A0A7Z8YB66_9ACTO|nr:Uncharacterised protein [Actinobaculum suis]
MVSAAKLYIYIYIYIYIYMSESPCHSKKNCTGSRVAYQLLISAYASLPEYYSAALMASTEAFASPRHMSVFSLKNSGFCTPA